MSEKFTASNGYEVCSSCGGVCVSMGCNASIFDHARADALAEYLQHERDEALGRWRDPEAPDMVVYRVPEADDGDGECILVTDDRTGSAYRHWRHDRREDHAPTANRYFAAHPIEEPRPWEDAKPGEAWLLTVGGVDRAAVRDNSGRFVLGSEESWLPVSPHVTAGRRIWPEADDQEVSR